MRSINIKISGMICDHCAKSAQDALNTLDGVNASVSFSEGLARVETQDVVELAQLLNAIESNGYHASLI